MAAKLETVLELSCTPQQFFTVWKSEAHQIPNHTPNNIHAVDVHEGDWETAGSLKAWKYTVDGTTETFKERIEVDEENMKVTLVGEEGDVMKSYKVFKPIYYLAPKGNGCLATCVIEYEKVNENVPAPDKYMEFMINATKEIDAGLVGAK
ncbi:MLP-like protein 34 [Ricinus communis]|uniref:Major latex protein, putative n=1 Tax=Ricinus communis TaxID=3988 RepID=B9SJ69_RICCO|nr:MLP-like protein 34 [Ricinus communis]EEF36378.1 Major latex protein, putative [Ricinus communis]|eukprot:XP_002526038.1 MLP-like protein 34 [Ricinus communis]